MSRLIQIVQWRNFNFFNFHSIQLSYFHAYLLVHPCDRKDEKACDQICNKVGDKHECACNKDFKLGDDKKTCEECE